MVALGFILFVLFLTYLCAFKQFGRSFRPGDESAWPLLCREGRRQSPINIALSKVIGDPNRQVLKMPLKLRQDAPPSTLISNIGTTVRFEIEPESQEIVLEGGPLDGKYILRNFEFKWPSEHTKDAIQYPLEGQFLFSKDGMPMEEAMKRPDGLAILSVMFKMTKISKRWPMDSVIYCIYQVRYKASDPIKKFVHLRRLLSQSDLSSYFAYNGSLTRPDCSENVVWLVLHKLVPINQKQLNIIHQIQLDGGVGAKNNRSTKPLGDRLVYST